MKIRRYQGHSLEKLYDAIREEMGPDAMVIASSNRPKNKMGALLAPLLGEHPYELIAVVEDQAAARHDLAGTVPSDEVRKLAALQARQLKQMESTLRNMENKMGVLQAATHVRNGQAGVPAGFAAGWDAEFLDRVLALNPRALDGAQRSACRAAVRSLLKVQEKFQARTAPHPHIVVLAGPTGSGKTTTLAKLAANWSFDQRLKVGIISTDTFRIAAVDQIKEYATLLGLDLRIAFSAGEAARAVREFHDKEVILVDTPGRSHYDQAGLAGLRGMLQGMGPMSVLLTLPATADSRNVPDILERFDVLNFNGLVVTKTDETRHYDLLTAVAVRTDKPILFITDGQRVPQDLRAARLEEVAAMLVPEEN